jgi:hypothetical protein
LRRRIRSRTEQPVIALENSGDDLCREPRVAEADPLGPEADSSPDQRHRQAQARSRSRRPAAPGRRSGRSSPAKSLVLPRNWDTKAGSLAAHKSPAACRSARSALAHDHDPVRTATSPRSGRG